MPPRKKKTTKKTTKNEGASPNDVVDDVETETPIVDEAPQTPQDKVDENQTDNSEQPKKRRKRRTKKITEEEQAKIDGDKAVATMLVSMQEGMCCRFAGEIWKMEAGEKEAMVGAFTRFLGQFDVLPWWVELALAQAAYLGPRIVMMRMMRQTQQPKSDVEEETQTTPTEATVVVGGDQLQPIGLG